MKGISNSAAAVIVILFVVVALVGAYYYVMEKVPPWSQEQQQTGCNALGDGCGAVWDAKCCSMFVCRGGVPLLGGGSCQYR